jgi:hypothetical protein
MGKSGISSFCLPTPPFCLSLLFIAVAAAAAAAAMSSHISLNV